MKPRKRGTGKARPGKTPAGKTPAGKTPTGKTLVRDARAVVETCPGLTLRMAARLVSRFFDLHLLESGLNLAQFGLMALIAASTDDTVGALAERAGLEQSTLSRNLRQLERDGQIEIAMVETDLRRRAVWLTEKGARQLEAAMPLWREAHRLLGRVLVLDDVARLGAAMPGLAKRLVAD
jgi:DNA-binding MarR family transcriptional regulator